MDYVRGAACVGVAINVCEFGVNLPDEIKWIWKSEKYSILHVPYVVARYGVFLSHILTFIYGAQYVGLDPSLPPPPNYNYWVLFKFLTWCSVVCIIDVTLSKRIYHLHNKGRWITSALSLVFVTRFCLIVYISIRIVHELKIQVPHIGKDSMPSSLLLPYTTGELLLQCTLVSLLHSKHQNSLVLSRVEAGLEVGAVTFFLAFSNYLCPMEYPVAVIVYPLFTGVGAAIACRLIISTERSFQTLTLIPLQPVTRQGPQLLPVHLSNQ